MSLPLLIIQPGKKLPSLVDVPGDFSDWILAGMGRDPAGVLVLHPEEGDALPSPAEVGAVVITGSGAMVTEQAAWMQEAGAWLREYLVLDRPVLGICFGHQLLAHALGGVVEDNPQGIEVGTVIARPAVAAGKDALFAGWSGRTPVQASHQQAVTRVPEGAVVLATSQQDPHHAFRYGKTAWGVQFHPEFDAEITAAYEDYYAPRLSPVYRERQIENRAETPLASAILRVFSELFP